MSSSIIPSSPSTPLESSTSGGGGAPKFKAQPPQASSAEKVTASMEETLAAKKLARGVCDFNNKLEWSFKGSTARALDDQFNKFESFIEMFMSPEVLAFSPTEQDPFSNKIYKGLPVSVRPECTKLFKDAIFHSCRKHGFCFPNPDAYFNISKFVEKIGSQGIVELGFGSGMIGRAIINLDISYHGHELESARKPYPYKDVCYLPKENYTIHEDKNDIKYLVEAAKNHQTLLLSCFSSEEIHKNFGAHDSLNIYINACNAHNIKGSVILISDPETTDGPKFQNLLNKKFKQNGKEIEITGWSDQFQPFLRFYEMK